MWQTFLRSLRLLSMVVWVGGILFFVIVVAPVAFADLPSRHLAGLVVRGSLLRLHFIGAICGCVFLAASALLAWANRAQPRLLRSFVIGIALLLPMSLCTLYSKEIVIPAMERDRATAGEINSLPAANPVRIDFERLHRQSTTLEGTVLLCGLGIIVVLAREPQLGSR
jgi:small-conductance mechanosensitive channel